MDGTRNFILHYHLFKNAGTSVDVMLDRNFGDRWEKAEFALDDHAANIAEVKAYIEARPRLVALSTHTAHLPPPAIDGVDILPVLFIRHPLLRIESAYRFEAKQGADTYGSQLARSTDLAGYLREQLAHGRFSQVRNFQTSRLSAFFPPDSGPPVERAVRAIAALPFVGLVERYQASAERLARMLRPDFPDFEPLIVQRNRTSNEISASVHQRIAVLRAEIGDELFEETMAANADDIRLYMLVMRHYFEAEPTS